jgi:hypothetical protein
MIAQEGIERWVFMGCSGCTGGPAAMMKLARLAERSAIHGCANDLPARGSERPNAKPTGENHGDPGKPDGHRERPYLHGPLVEGPDRLYDGDYAENNAGNDRVVASHDGTLRSWYD